MDEFHPAVVVVNMEEDEDGDENSPVDGDGPVLSQDGDGSSDELASTENHPQATEEDHSTEDPQPHGQDPQPHNQESQPKNQHPQMDGSPFPENHGPESGNFFGMPAAGARSTNKFSYECPDCGKTYTQLGYLLNHVRVHRQASKSLDLELEQLKKKSFRCETCGRSYSRASALDAHRRCHEGKLIKGKLGRSRSSDGGGRCSRDAEGSMVGDDVDDAEGGDPSEGETVYADGDKAAGQDDLSEGPLEDKGAGDGVLLATGQPALAPSAGVVAFHTEGPKRDESAAEAVPAVGTANENAVAVSPALGTESFECTCGKSFPALSRLRTHQRFSRNVRCAPERPAAAAATAVQPKKAFQCPECSKTFGGHIALVNHRRWHANRSADAGQKFPCEECGKVFMTLTFYYKHQRSAHSQDTAAKSFLNQVGQLQKKAFECPDCGLRFSRASALQAHQLHHTNVFGEKEPPLPARGFSAVPEKSSSRYGREETNLRALPLAHGIMQVAPQPVMQANLHPVTQVASHLVTHANFHSVSQLASEPATMAKEVSGEFVGVEGDEVEDGDSEEGYETADFHVEVISASESEEEEENAQDQNPDLELLCESDQENNAVSVSTLPVSKPGGVDLKIVQIDFEAAGSDGQAPVRPPESETTKVERKVAHHPEQQGQPAPPHHPHHQDRFHCPECPRWFCSPSSLRVHRLWHGVLKNKLTRNPGDPGKPKKVYTCDACGHETFNRVTHCNHILKHKYLKQAAAAAGLRAGQGADLRCDECGKRFSRVSTLVSHQMQHAKRKPYPCPDCATSYASASALFDHKRHCPGQKPADDEDNEGPPSKKEFNPTKTLLGPKLYHCERCGKGFWSLGAYSHHKQSQCANPRLKNGAAATNGHSRSSGRKVACPVCGRKFRHQGIMKSHMRKHEDGSHACELCGRTFRLFSSLLRHSVVHRAQQAGAVPPPSKSFQHQVEQVQKNTYGCPDCGKLFSRAKALQFHMRSHGYESGYSPSSPPRAAAAAPEALQCPTCLAHFDRKSSLRAHRKLCVKREVNTANPDPTHAESTVEIKAEAQATGGARSLMGHKCTECPMSFAAAGALDIHQRIHRQDPDSEAKAKLSALFHDSTHGDHATGPFPCSECGRRFTTNSALGTHKRWHADKEFAVSLAKDWKHDASPVAAAAADSTGVPYRCQSCGKGFFYMCVFRRHQIFCQGKATGPDENVAAEKESAELLPCPECDKTFPRGPSLAAHYESEHSAAAATMESADLPGEQPNKAPQRPGTPANNPSDPDYVPLIVRGRVQCPLCRMTFAKLRGLRAHHWQAHATHARHASKAAAAADDSSSANLAQSIPDGIAGKQRKRRRKRVGVKPNPRGAFPCPHCGKKYSSPGALHNHRKTCLLLTPEPPSTFLRRDAGAAQKPLVKQESPPPPTRPPLEKAASNPGRPSEHHHHHNHHSVKYLFKCAKCGKAFQSEEQLAAHKAAGRSRPYCCALCCSGYWTEAQLQQHLTWHDEVRRRLPIELRYRLGATSAAAAPSSSSSSRPPPPPTPGRLATPSVDASPKSQTTTAPAAAVAASHKCQHCGRSFLSPTALAKHEAQHASIDGDDGDAYTCPYCPRAFRDIQALIDHHQKCMGEFVGQPSPPPAPATVAAPPVAVVTATGDHAGNDLSCLE